MIKIIQKENKILRQIAKEIPPEEIQSAKIKNIIERLKQVVIENEEAVAAAGPQIGESLRVFVVSEYIFAPKDVTKTATEPDFVAVKNKSDYGFMVFINSKIIKKSRGKILMTEGCLSVKDVYGTIRRAEKIKVEAYDENGKRFVESGAGLFSQVIQHEIDHLDGILFSDKAIMLKKYEQPKK